MHKNHRSQQKHIIKPELKCMQKQQLQHWAERRDYWECQMEQKVFDR